MKAFPDIPKLLTDHICVLGTLGWILSLCLAIGLFTEAYCDDGVDSLSNKAIPGPTDSSDAEPAAKVVRKPSIQKAERSALVEKLHEARLAGDLDELRKLEAMLHKKPAEGEAAGPTVLIPSTTVGGKGDPTLFAGGAPNNNPLFKSNGSIFGADEKVRSSNHMTKEWNQAMASDSSGNLYVAWQDDYLAYDYIQVYWSTDGGMTWSGMGYVQNAQADLREPSLAVGEGANGDTLLLAYIYDDGVNIQRPEVAITPLGVNSFTAYAVPIWSDWEGYAKPAITTDSVDFSGWFAYLTCEGIYGAAADNINVCSWRSTDGGVTWGDDQVVLGSATTSPYRDADNAYGTTLNRVFLVTFNDYDDTLYTVYSNTYAVTWETEVAFYTMTDVPIYDVDPEIAAAVDTDNVMVCCTKSFAGNDNIGQGYSTDAGDAWTTLWSLDGYTAEHEWAATLIANEGGNDWHVAYTSQHRVFHSRRPQDLSHGWWPTPGIVDDLGRASAVYSKKGIATNWTDNRACIAWADYRDGSPDYDCYADCLYSPGLMLDIPEISSAVGGSVNFTLTGGPANAGRSYAMFMSGGYDVGILVPGSGGLILPLNPDGLFLYYTMIFPPPPPVFVNFVGTLDSMGSASASFNYPYPMPGMVGTILCFAYLCYPPINWASNAVAVRITL